MLPRPLAASPSSVWSAWPLAALSHASARRAGAWPLRPSGAAAARLRPLASAVSRRLVLRRPLWRVLVAANAVFFSPLTTPLFSPWRWRAAMRKISVRGGKKQLCPRPPKDGRLSCGRGPRLGCVRGHREKAVCLPAFGRARSACRAVCAVRALRRASPPSSGGQVRALKGAAILQREHRGRARAFRRSDRRRGRRLSPKPCKNPRSDQKRGFIRRASGRRGMGHSVRRWRRSACSAANNRRIRLQARPRTPCDKDKIYHPAGIGRPRSSGRFDKSSGSGARRLPFCASPLAILSRARPLPCCPHRPHPVYTGRGWGSKHFLSFFALKNRWPRFSTRRRSPARQRAPSPALGAQ